LKEEFAYCRACGSYIEVGRKKFCCDECRSEYRQQQQGKPEIRYVALLRILEQERVNKSDLLWHPEFYFSLIADNTCTYCTGPLSRSGIALDRIINKLGHRCWNVTACCSMCNKIKSGNDGLLFEEMLELREGLSRISLHRLDTRQH
jgi:hypothetical protein